MTYLFCIVNIMAADDLATQAVMASATMIMTVLKRINSVKLFCFYFHNLFIILSQIEANHYYTNILHGWPFSLTYMLMSQIGGIFPYRPIFSLYHKSMYMGCKHVFISWSIYSQEIYLGKTGGTWWRHQMEAFLELLTLYEGNSPVTGEFPSQRPVTRSFDVFFDLRLNKRLS